jgi:hypothetical protein
MEVVTDARSKPQEKPEQPAEPTQTDRIEALLATLTKQMEAAIWCLGGPDVANAHRLNFMAKKQLEANLADAAASKIVVPSLTLTPKPGNGS